MRTTSGRGDNVGVGDVPLPGAIRLPDGARVRGRGLRRPAAGGVPEFGLYLGSARLRRKHEAGIGWPAAWVDWPDFGLPREPEDAVARIRDLYERVRAGAAAEVACGGGVGRTGTVIACLAILAGEPAESAVTWVRTHYHRRAVETGRQKAWVAAFRA